MIKTDRAILHSDMNAFFASVECLDKPELRKVPVAVGGSEEARHGVVLAKNQLAKERGVKTGEPLRQARQKCPRLVVVPPDHSKYKKYSQLAREIYLQYTDRFEPFGIDEGWLDVTESVRLFGSGREIAHDIRRRMKLELGLTVSVGVSWNKVFAKLGSDYKKPDAVTVFDRSNYKQFVYPQPVSNLLYVGRSTANKLNLHGIRTIGQLAAADPHHLELLLGKWGLMLHDFACGNDDSPVAKADEQSQIKSVSNSITTPRDLVSDDDVKIIFTVLAASVARRLRERSLYGRMVRIWVRDNTLHSFTRQCHLDNPTCLASELVAAAMELFRRHYNWSKPIRSLGLGAADLAEEEGLVTQCDIFSSERERDKKEHLARVMDEIKDRFGNASLRPASLLTDTRLADFTPKDDPVTD